MLLKEALAELGFKGGTRSKTERNQWVAAEKERLADIMLQHGIEWEKKGTHEKHLNIIRNLTGEYKKKEPDCREGVRAQLERMKELCKERNILYEKQSDLKGQKWEIEKLLER